MWFQVEAICTTGRLLNAPGETRIRGIVSLALCTLLPPFPGPCACAKELGLAACYFGYSGACPSRPLLANIVQHPRWDRIYVCSCVHVCERVSEYEYIYIYIYMCIYMFVYVCVHACIYVCMYLCVYVCIV